MNQSVCPAVEPQFVASSEPSAMLRRMRAHRFLWPFASLLMVALVLLVLPGARIQLGASQLQGLVGSYTGHGNWLITASYSGTATWTLNGDQDSEYDALSAYVDDQSLIAGGSYGQSDPAGPLDLSTLPVVTTVTGGASTRINLGQAISIWNGSMDSKIQMSGASINYNLVWLPSTDYPTEPPPKKVVL